jgi:predicted HicB family RNase H-like nuclease
MKMLTHRGYYGSFEFSLEEGIMFGKLLYLHKVLVNYEGETLPELVESFEAAVDDYLQDCENRGSAPQKPFKGSFNVRTGEERHERAVVAAQKHNIKSLNDFINTAIDHELERLGG